MDCYTFCTASSYEIKPLFQSLKTHYNTTMYRDTIHLEIPKSNGDSGDIFIFTYGSIVCWNLSLNEGESFLKEVRDFEAQPLEKAASDNFLYSYGHLEVDIVDGEIYLPDHDIRTKVAISHGLAQSAKLGAFEGTLADVFKQTRHIPEGLALHGKISLSRREIRKKMGQLFIDRSSINLHVDVLDTPEFFWEHPELESIYTVIANELDIATRGQILNQRLDVIRELFEMLGNELNHQHSNRLEWIIIWLIVSEVVISLSTHFHLV